MKIDNNNLKLRNIKHIWSNTKKEEMIQIIGIQTRLELTHFYCFCFCFLLCGLIKLNLIKISIKIDLNKLVIF
jgi:hypothetical protein